MVLSFQEQKMHIAFPNKNTMLLSGEVRTIENYTDIKNAVLSFIATGEKVLIIEITDSMTITSAIIGFFTKIIHRDGINLSLLVHDNRLYSLLEDLNLIKLFNVRHTDSL
jgi:type IV secretory pathway ATPase VirB11/archaellum biosynthesis ATPase